MKLPSVVVSRAVLTQQQKQQLQDMPPDNGGGAETASQEAELLEDEIVKSPEKENLAVKSEGEAELRDTEGK